MTDYSSQESQNLKAGRCTDLLRDWEEFVESKCKVVIFSSLGPFAAMWPKGKVACFAVVDLDCTEMRTEVI